MAACNIWEDQQDNAGFVLWVIIVALPVLFGPVLTGILELLFWFCKKCSSSPPPASSPSPSQAKYWAIVLLLSLLLPPSLAAHLWLVESVLQPLLGLDYATSLALKYFLGNSDVFLVPSLLLLVDGTLRRGLVFVCRMRKDNPPENV